MTLNDAKVQFPTSHKHLVLILDSRLDFIEHIANKYNKYKQIMGMMKKRSLTQSKKILLRVCNKNYPSFTLNHAKVQFPTSHKHLVLISDSRLDFIKHIDNKINKFKQIKDMMKRRSLAPSTKFLLTIYNKNYPSLMHNDARVKFVASQKHLVFILDSRLDFIEHIDNKLNKYNKIIGMMKRRSSTQSRKILLTIYNKKYPSLMLCDTKVKFATSQKNLIKVLDSRLDFVEHIDNKINKCKKMIGVMKRRS